MRNVTVFLLVAATVACSRAKSQVSGPPAAHTATAAPAQPSGGTAVGDVMPAYSSKFLDGKPFDLRAAKGSVVFVNVWATWCGPCRFEIPELQAMHQKYASRGFEVIGISVDESGAKAVQQFVNDNKITYPIALDAQGHIADVLHTNVLPTSFILDRNGRIIWRWVGAMTPNDVATVDGIVERALQAKS